MIDEVAIKSDVVAALLRVSAVDLHDGVERRAEAGAWELDGVLVHIGGAACDVRRSCRGEGSLQGIVLIVEGVGRVEQLLNGCVFSQTSWHRDQQLPTHVGVRDVANGRDVSEA